MSGCKYKIGLFSLRDCGEPIVGHCASCDRPVCGRHAKAEEAGLICPECYVAQRNGQDWDDDDDASEVRYRRTIYHGSGFSGFYHGHGSSRYEHDEYMAFENGAEDQGFDDEGDISPGDFQDS